MNTIGLHFVLFVVGLLQFRGGKVLALGALSPLPLAGCVACLRSWAIFFVADSMNVASYLHSLKRTRKRYMEPGGALRSFTVQGHSVSSKLVPIESPYATSY